MSAEQTAVESSQRKIVEFVFPRGIPGLELFRRFLIEPVPDNRLFAMLIAAEDPTVGMILVDPLPFFPRYKVTLERNDRKDLMLKKDQDLVIFTTVTVEGEFLYTNLAAPILINVAQRRGKQLIIPHRCDDMRVPLDAVAGPDN
jgi:flagellar assembly factor FliW